MQTKPKANSVITHAVDNGVIHFNVRDAGSVALDIGSLSDAVRHRAMVHGMIQRISDAAAIARNPLTGLAASPQDKLAAMSRLVDHYMTGTDEWRMTGAGGGRRTNVDLLLAALTEYKPEKSPDELAAYVAKLEKKQVSQLLASDQLREIVARLRGEEDAGDATEMLAGL